MIDRYLEKFAELLVGYSCSVKAGDNVSLNVHTPATPLARALVRSVLAKGAKPHLRMSYPELDLDLVSAGTDAYFASEPELEMEEIRRTQAWIRVRAPLNTRALQNADKSRYNRLLKRNRPVQDYRIGHTRWVGTIYPTNAGAQDAGMSLEEYERFVCNSMFLLDDDPVARWKEQAAFQERLVERLAQAREVRITADGTDLTMSVAGRTWVNSHGERNMPDGEVFTGPIESSANGTIRFTVPSAVEGVAVEDVRLRFEQGRVVEASAARGNDLLQAQLDSDRGARYLGELGIGTNYNIAQPTMSVLYDEKIGGTVHLALGSSYTQTGGVNESAIHWDMVCDLREGGAIHLDGEKFQENGRFLL